MLIPALSEDHKKYERKSELLWYNSGEYVCRGLACLLARREVGNARRIRMVQSNPRGPPRYRQVETVFVRATSTPFFPPRCGN